MVNNSRGAALLMMTFVVLVVVLLLGQALISDSSTSTDNIEREKRIVAGRAAMMDFAAMAQRANELYVTKGNCVGVAGTTADSLGRPFCWPVAAGGNENCIRHPLDKGKFLCLDSANARIEVAVQSRGTDWFSAFSKLRQKALKALSENLNDSAEAQTWDSATFRPTLAGAPTNNLALATCTSGTVGGQNCKRCTDGPGVHNVQCVTLRMCLRETSACSGSDWIIQAIGVMPRT